MKRRHRGASLLCSSAPLGALTLVLAQGCSSTTTGTSLSEGGIVPAGNGGIGFAPSNIVSALSGIDASSLQDVDITEALSVASDTDDSDELLGFTSSYEPGGVVYRTVVQQSNNVQIGVYIARSWRLEDTASLHVIGAYPIAFVAMTTINIAGPMDASPGSYNPTAGGGFATNPSTAVGGGPGGGGAGTGSGTTSAGVGGGGGGFCGAGGSGGLASGALGTAGKVYGSPTLVPINGGSAGGGGAESGGTGGGAIQLVAGTSVTVSSAGSVAAGGGGGLYGGGGGAQAAAGGGSGGAILIEAPTVTIGGTIAVNGGAGGGGANPGQDGQVGAVPAAGGTPGPGGGNTGGNGGAASSANGVGAVSGTTNGAASAGGGGGAGYIRINASGSAAIAVTGTLSPSLGQCASLGTIAQ